jgi:hypothetical protein
MQWMILAVLGAVAFAWGLQRRLAVARWGGLALQCLALLWYLRSLDFGALTFFRGSSPGAAGLGYAWLHSYCCLRQAGGPGAALGRRYLLPVLAWLGLGCLYLLPPLNFDYQGTAAGWALCGLLSVAAAAWLGAYSLLLCGLAVQLCAGGAMLLFSQGLWGDLLADNLQPFAHGDFLVLSAIALAGLLGAASLRRQACLRGGWRLAQGTLLAWGVGWWLLALAGEVLRFAPPAVQGGLLLVLAVIGTALAGWWLSRPVLTPLWRLLMPLLAMAAVAGAACWR